MADIFLSHTTADDAFVAQLRIELETAGYPVWTDSRSVRGGDVLDETIYKGIEEAKVFMVVLSKEVINSAWVPLEIKHAESIQEKKADYRIVPILLPGIQPTAIRLFFQKEHIGIPIASGPNALSEAFSSILVALGERLPTDPESPERRVQSPISELRLELEEPGLEERGGKYRATAKATLVYRPADPSQREQQSKPFRFESPLGPIEKEDLSWYLERYVSWPVGYYQEKAKAIEAKFPEWGKLLHKEATKTESGKETFRSWLDASNGTERRFSIYVDEEIIEGSLEEDVQTAKEGANLLLSLPWELLHDNHSFLFQGNHPAHVRRRLPHRDTPVSKLLQLPIRVLLISPRPEDKGSSYIDHRASALPLVEAVESLDQLVKLDILHEPTLPALRSFLKEAADANDPVDVLHFDGHGVYDKRHGLGALCFEEADDQEKVGKRRTDLVNAEELGKLLRGYHIPLVFLEACQSAQADKDPTSSVAARLLQVGVSSVVAMSHSVLVETSRRFVRAFYGALARGKRVGEAMLAGQQYLYDDSRRGKLMGAKDFKLQDWFVPVLFQEQQDPALFQKLPTAKAKALQKTQRKYRLGTLPETPSHTFVGRSRELLRLERILRQQPYVVVRGQGGAGKTTLGVELARWLVRSRRAERAAFVSLESFQQTRQVLDKLGQQLLPDYSVAEYGEDLNAAYLPIERALREAATILVLDNLESILPDAEGNTLLGTSDSWEELKGCFSRLQAAAAHTKLIFTSREPLLAPFDGRANDLELGPLSPKDSLNLLSQVMANEGWEPPLIDEGREEELRALAKTVNHHARALVLLAREIADQGVVATTADISALMERLEKKHPGDRENSLFASLELSLRRLSEEQQALLPVLAPCQGGNNWIVWAMMLGEIEKTQGLIQSLTARLIEVGLAIKGEYGYIQLDPALPIYLRRQMSPEAFQDLQGSWLEAMKAYTRFLYQQQSQDAQLQAYLSQVELPNLLHQLRLEEKRQDPEVFLGLAHRVEALLQVFHLPKGKAEVIALREKVGKGLSAWSHAHFLQLDAQVDRLLAQGRMQEAYAMAQKVLQEAQRGGEASYPEAGFDLAMAHFSLGRVLLRGGVAQAALPQLEKAKQRFGKLGKQGDSAAAVMVAKSLAEMADCFSDLGQYDKAVEAYDTASKFSEELGDQRTVAVVKIQMGTVKLKQKDYSAALEAYLAANEIFEKMGERAMEAVAWHQIARVYQEQGFYSQAEEAYRKSLRLKVQTGNRSGEASTLGQLGNLYSRQGKLEESVTFTQQAATIYSEIQDLAKEGVARSNLADDLIKLKRYDEARKELLRAIECKKGRGHAAEPWKTFMILHNLELATQKLAASAAAKAKAMELYLAYRRDGGAPQAYGGQLCEQIWHLWQAKQVQEIEQVIAAELEDENEYWRMLGSKLQAIMQGSRNPDLAEDKALNFADAAELRLLLERLGEMEG